MGVAVSVGTGVKVADGVGVKVSVAVAVGVSVGTAVNVGEAVSVAVAEAVMVGVIVSVAVGVCVAVGVFVEVGVKEGINKKPFPLLTESNAPTAKSNNKISKIAMMTRPKIFVFMLYIPTNSNSLLKILRKIAIVVAYVESIPK